MAVPQQARAMVDYPPDAERMDQWPLLVQTAKGPDGIRVARRGIRLTEILAARDSDPEGDMLIRFDITPEEWDEILRWEADPAAPGKDRPAE